LLLDKAEEASVLVASCVDAAGEKEATRLAGAERL